MSSNLDLNINDPAVKRLLGTDDSRIQQPGARKRSMVQLAGDAPDPTGVTGFRGLQSTTRLDMGKLEVLVIFKDRVMTVDVYKIEGEPIELLLICPRCENESRITSEMKKIEFEYGNTRPVKLPDGSLVSFDKPQHTHGHVYTNAGSLSVEPFQCSWEMKGAGKHTPGIRAGGLTLCNLKLVIDNNVAREA